MQTWNSSVHASSKLELATWRWWDASPGVVVQHLGLSVFSRRICVFEVRPCIPMCWSEAKMKAVDFMSSHASHLYSWMLFAFDLKLWFLLLKNFKFLTFNLVDLANLHTLDLFCNSTVDDCDVAALKWKQEPYCMAACCASWISACVFADVS